MRESNVSGGLTEVVEYSVELQFTCTSVGLEAISQPGFVEVVSQREQEWNEQKQ